MSTSTKSMQDYALEYAALGWHVFPLLPRRKEPATEHGLHDSSNNAAEVTHLWAGRPSHNIGLRTGKVSGFWVLDVDSDEAQAWLEAQGGLPPTLTSRTSKGRHYLFKYPADREVRNTTSRIRKNIDTRGDGGYIVAPPSRHDTTEHIYHWINPEAEILDAPDWLYQAMEKRHYQPQALTQEPVDHRLGRDLTHGQLIQMLSHINPDCDYNTWVEIGMGLKEGGWPVDVWDNWSRGGAKYKAGECQRKWPGFDGTGITFATVVHYAQLSGWEYEAKDEINFNLADVGGVDLRDFVKTLDEKRKHRVSEIRKAKRQAMAEEIAESIIKLPALVHETVQYIESRSFRSQPELALLNTLAVLGAIFGRRYGLEKLDTRTNIYLVGIAETGMGKDSSRSAIKTLVRLAGLEEYLGPDEIRSGPGLLIELTQKPSLMVSFDEIGLAMQAIHDAKAPAYLKEISAIMTKLYSSSDNTYMGGLIASKPGERVTLTEPNLCVYGTTTLGSYGDAMKKSAIKSGEINRFIIVRPKDLMPEPRFDTAKVDPPTVLVERWRKFCPPPEAANRPNAIIEKKIVRLGDCAQMVNDLLLEQDKAMRQYHHNGLSALWVRYRENVLKIAMILAIARDHENPALTADDIESGKSLVGNSISFMLKFAEEKMYDSDFEKKCQQFLEFLDRYGGKLSRSEMMRSMHIKSKEMNEIELALEEAGQITFDIKARPRIYERA